MDAAHIETDRLADADAARTILAELLTLRAEVELLREDKRRLLSLLVSVARQAGQADRRLLLRPRAAGVTR